jgi:hypothetical protein
MTYVPVPTDERRGHGRTPLEIPDALVRQLQHSAATGAKCVIDIDETDPPDPEQVAELRRALVRASYRLFGDKTVCKRFSATQISYWVEAKKPRPAKGRRKSTGGKS